MLLQLVGEGLKSPLYGHGGAGAALGLVGEVEVFELGHVGGGKNLLLQLGGELALLADGGQDGIAPFVQLLESDEEVADGGNLHFVEAACGLLAVAGNEGDCSPLLQEFDGFLDLTDAEAEMLGNGVGVVHALGGKEKEPVSGRALLGDRIANIS